MSESPIHHVSDTAFWVAAFRAEEVQRPDAVFWDPVIGKLVGTKGEEIRRVMPHNEFMSFAMIIRTTGIDQLVQYAIEAGVDTVINLGAGLDTRPYRLKLPPQLKWIEVD